MESHLCFSLLLKSIEILENLPGAIFENSTAFKELLCVLIGVCDCYREIEEREQGWNIWNFVSKSFFGRTIIGMIFFHQDNPSFRILFPVCTSRITCCYRRIFKRHSGLRWDKIRILQNVTLWRQSIWKTERNACWLQLFCSTVEFAADRRATTLP